MKSAVVFILLVMLCCVLFTACPSKDNEVLPYPECMEAAIDSILAMPILEPPGRVEQWVINGDPYYYVAGGCCDFFNYLYDSDCARVCAPDGGITGNGDGKCPEFSEIIKITVWEDAP